MAGNRKHPFHFFTNSKGMADTGVNRAIFSFCLGKEKEQEQTASMFQYNKQQKHYSNKKISSDIKFSDTKRFMIIIRWRS